MPEVVMTDKAREKKWREEDDVRTLANAQEIQKDKGRLTRAAKRATVMANDVAKQATNLRKVARKKPVVRKKTTTKRTVRKRG